MERLRGEFENLKKMVSDLKNEMAKHRKAANHAADHFEVPKKSGKV
jgi:hypothetical protein